jgi:hypothetical protein
MAGSPIGPHAATPRELRERLAAERRGAPFLVYRDGGGAQHIVELTAEGGRRTIGRDAQCDVALGWDAQVSRLHAELERVAARWLVVDDGLSSNGTFVGGERVLGRRRLADGDLVRVGSTTLAYREPLGGETATTRASDEAQRAASVTAAQRRVLVALCRPLAGGRSDAVPATNPQIAAELHLTVAAVKTHLRALFRRFGIDDLPQQEKRRRLATLAFSTGLLTQRELRDR